MNLSEEWSVVVRALALAIPAVFVLGATTWPRRALVAGGVALGLAMCFTVGAVMTSGPARGLTGVRVDAVTCVMLLLVCGIGLVIVKYSQTYLHGDPRLARHLRWLLLTLGAVTSLVIANHLLIMAAAWTATSLALHQLLTFFADRRAALVAAHKKFLVSRLADVCFWSSLAIVQVNVGSLDLDRLGDWARAHPELPFAMQLAAVLVVIAVALKSAQLPFHGWLIQVMEAPTPVSALLHAGVVNIGGLVLIRLAPWMAQATIAQLLLTVLGLVTAVLAALVMTTRVSVKVALAWSTCAQMGFMLVQCGLGAWHLALLHLVAHSLYKAHAFLTAGSAVEAWRLEAAARRAAGPSRRRLGLWALVALGGAVLAVAAARALPSAPRDGLGLPVLAMLVALSLVPLLAWRGRSAPALAVRAVGVALLYVAWHLAAARLVPAPPIQGWQSVGWAIVAGGVALLFVGKALLALHPEGRLARAAYAWLFAGLYLDERFTRLTFRLWPPRLPRPEAARAPRIATPLEAR